MAIGNRVGVTCVVIIVRTRSMTRRHNYDTSSRKRKNTCEDGGGVAWSDLNHDVLYSVMMQLGAVESISFSGVCKSWRSLALSNKKKFLVSKPPMAMFTYKNTYRLQDFKGKRFKTFLPHSANRTCIGVTCGYLILIDDKTRDFWLVNLITRHELHFPDAPFDVGHHPERGGVRAILTFSTSINGWVFVMLKRFEYQIWFSTAGKGTWNHVSSTFPLLDLHPFNGKIYTLNMDCSGLGRHVYEMRINPVPKLTLLDMHFMGSVFVVMDFISSDENLYLMEYWPEDDHKVHKLDFDQLNWAPCEKTKEEYALFFSCMKHGATVAVKPESWAAPSSQYCRFFGIDHKAGKGRCLRSKLWYFPHDCLNVTRIE